MNKILIIQQKMIGDVLTSTFMCEIIKKKYPDCIVDYLINSNTLPVVEGNPYIDNIITLTKDDEKNIFSLIKFTKKHVSGNYDAVIDVYSKMQSNIISLFSKAKLKISYKKWYTSWIYNHSITTDYFNSNGALNGRLCFLKPIFKDQFNITKPKIHLSDSEIEKGLTFLKLNGITDKQNVYMIGVLGSDFKKTLPLTEMAKIIDRIAIENPDARFLFNYIPSQFKEAEQVFNLCNSVTQKQIILNAYAKSLRDFICVLKHCKALIGNEGGAVNMAKALNIPTFSIYSPQITKEAWNIFADNKNIGVHLRDYKPELFEKSPNYLELYQEFTFELFKKELIQFLTNIQ